MQIHQSVAALAGARVTAIHVAMRERCYGPFKILLPWHIGVFLLPLNSEKKMGRSLVAFTFSIHQCLS